MEQERINPGGIAPLLKGIDRYNPENLKVLEPYVKQQVEENSYDISANLAVLKLYQFNPTYFMLDVVSKILMKTLMSLPSSDFTLCKSLIDQQYQDKPEIGRVIFLHQLLETCNFEVFWQEIGATPELIQPILGFQEAIREYICHIVSITFQRIEASKLMSLLGDISEEVFEKLIAEKGWKRLEGQEGLLFVANQEEKVKTRNIVEKVTFDKLKGIIQAST